ncbi:MAG: glycosyltransferase family 2 protein [Rudaea sp.]
MTATALPVAQWLGWDGRRLRLHAAGACELHVDGALFESVASGETARDLAFAPGGGDELEFSLCTSAGAALAPVWRVRYGTPAVVGADVWSGPIRALQPLTDTPLPEPDVWHSLPSATIVVPIYNSPQCVQRCIAALLRYTPAPRRLILIDDASTDPACTDVLAAYAGNVDIDIRCNPHNLGYTATCNLGIALAGDSDVVLLNSDTQVGPRWLERLRLTAYADGDIGTVTAVSDNAGAFTVPELERDCPMPARWTLAQTQRALLQQCGGCLPEMPTGNGFCMYVKREVFDRIGVFDAQAFAAGYGEENDLCQRAERAGYRHVIAGDVLVQHARSASFGEARRLALGAQGMAVLRDRYPEYETKVGANLHSFDRRVLDWRVRRLYAGTDGHYAAQPPRPRVLIADASVVASDSTLEVFTHDAAPTDASALRAWLAHNAIEAVVTRDATIARIAASVAVAVLTELDKGQCDP